MVFALLAIKASLVNMLRTDAVVIAETAIVSYAAAKQISSVLRKS